MSIPRSRSRFRRRAPGIVSLGILAWLSVLIVPCTVAVSGQSFSTPTVNAVVEADNTHHPKSSGRQGESADQLDGHGDHHSAQALVEALVEANDECHSGHAAAGPMESGCCCDVTVLSGTDNEKPQQFAAVFEYPVDQLVAQLRQLTRVVSQYHGPPRHQSSPPVYLSTQRFRI